MTTEPSVIAFGGPRALLLQVLHPLVAAGVEDHSDYEAHPWRRLYRTLDTVLKLAFADPETSAARQVMLHRRHLRVTGVSPDGVAYQALDPDLLVWVWATLIDTAVLVYERAVRPLSAAELAVYYEEEKLVAYACGVPEGGCPPTWPDFRAYVGREIDTSLRVTDTTRRVAASITKPPLWGPASSLSGAAIAAVTAELLPPRFAAELGLRSRRRLARALFAASRGAARVTPARLRRLPLAPFVGARPQVPSTPAR